MGSAPNKVLHGAYNTDPYTCGSTTCQGLAANAFETIAQADLAMVLWYGDWSEFNTTGDYVGPASYLVGHDPIAREKAGRNLMIGLVPNHRTAAQIVAGVADADAAQYFADAAFYSQGDAALGRASYALWFRLMNEMDLPNTFPIESNSEPLKYGGNPQTYVDAYRRIYNIAEQVGATGPKHAWVWSPGQWAVSPMAYYPGGNYVNWAGMSVYSALNECNSFSSLVSGWHTQFASTKPMMITEGAAASCQSSSSFKADWIDAWFSAPSNFAAIRAMVWFNEDVSQPSAYHDYSLSSSGSDVSHYRSGVSSTNFLKTFSP